VRRVIFVSLVPMLSPAQTTMTKSQHVLVLRGSVRIRRTLIITTNTRAYVLVWYGARILHILFVGCGL
jgi:hypothetical protein